MNKRQVIKITRSNFPNQSMIYWMNYFINILEQKYEVIIDTENPDLVFWTNIHFSTNEIDLFTNQLATSHTQYPNAKKIFCSCEMVPNHIPILDMGDDYYVIGPEPIIHERYLHLPIHNTTAAWGLYDESKLFDDPYDWLTKIRDGEKILSDKKYFCGVVQNSTVQMRVDLFNKLSEPNCFAITFLIPATSKTVLTAPPAITPEPSIEGRIIILQAPLSPTTPCGILNDFVIGIFINFYDYAFFI